MSATGVTGRKIFVDTYGGMAGHGGGTFSGKTPSKVDRSAASARRWVTKNVVATGLVGKCEVQVAYAIGEASPVGFSCDTFGDGRVSQEQIRDVVLQVFDLCPATIVHDLGLLDVKYSTFSAYEPYGRRLSGMNLEQTDRADALRAAL